MTPCAHSHSTRSGVLWPVRLSHTRRSRSGGRSSGKVKGVVRPACHTCQAAGVAAASCEEPGGGSAARIALRRSRSHGCSTALVPRAAGYSRTRPDAGWNRVRILPPIIFPGRPERWWGDEALKAEADPPQATLEQRHQATGDILALRRRGFFSTGVLFSRASHIRVEPPK